jgi:hypothetical protein
MNPNNNLEVISRDAVFASVLAGVTSYVCGTNKTMWQKMTDFRIRMLLPKDVISDEDKATATFLFFASLHTENLEVMADIFKLFSGHNDVLPSLTIIAKGRPMRETDSEEIKNLYIEQLVSMLHLAGAKDLKKAYEELDAIALEHGVSGMGEAEIKEVTL